jgi:hypothetical protein
MNIWIGAIIADNGGMWVKWENMWVSWVWLKNILKECGW